MDLCPVAQDREIKRQLGADHCCPQGLALTASLPLPPSASLQPTGSGAGARLRPLVLAAALPANPASLRRRRWLGPAWGAPRASTRQQLPDTVGGERVAPWRPTPVGVELRTHLPGRPARGLPRCQTLADRRGTGELLPGAYRPR